METQFFEWDGWDQQDTMSFTFYECKLLDGVMPELKVREFPCAFVDYSSGVIEFYDVNNEVAATFDLKLEAKIRNG